MKRLAIFICALLSMCCIAAGNDSDIRDKNEDNFEFSHHRASITGVLTSSDSWQVEFAYHYMFNKFIGIGGGAGGWKVYFEEGHPSGGNWEIENSDSKPSNFYIRPSLLLKTPSVKIKQVNVGLFTEPGVMMNLPYQSVWISCYTQWPAYESKRVSTSKGQWFAVDLRCGIYANIGPCGVSAGYFMSNLDVYSQYRHLSYNGTPFSRFYPTKSFMQGGYITLSYYF